ncbi:MAG: DUF2892 domain-containing protein [Acidimicrobiia bacterium]|nr:DUF2892 domain-containing protein [Acidimicrobiia bacterium]
MSYMNEGTVDRVVRIALGILLLVLGFGGIVEGTLGTVFKFLGFVPLLTGLAGWCPIYADRSSVDADFGQEGDGQRTVRA